MMVIKVMISSPGLHLMMIRQDASAYLGPIKPPIFLIRIGIIITTFLKQSTLKSFINVNTQQIHTRHIPRLDGALVSHNPTLDLQNAPMSKSLILPLTNLQS